MTRLSGLCGRRNQDGARMVGTVTRPRQKRPCGREKEHPSLDASHPDTTRRTHTGCLATLRTMEALAPFYSCSKACGRKTKSAATAKEIRRYEQTPICPKKGTLADTHDPPARYAETSCQPPTHLATILHAYRIGRLSLRFRVPSGQVSCAPPFRSGGGRGKKQWPPRWLRPLPPLGAFTHITPRGVRDTPLPPSGGIHPTR